MNEEQFRKKYPALWKRFHKERTSRVPPKKREGIKAPERKPTKHSQPWSKEDIDFLEFNWGTHTIEFLCKHLERTHPSVIAKAEHLDLGSMNRGKVSLNTLAKTTGYDRTRLLTAAKRTLRVLPHARSRRGTTYKKKGRHYAFDLEHVDLILEELAKHPDGKRLWVTHAHEWGGTFRNGKPKPDKCVDCLRDDTYVHHYSKGRCRLCHDRRRKKIRGRIPKHVWEGRQPPHCKTCKETSIPHLAKGCCRRCYQRQWRQQRAGVVGLDRRDNT
jgi:hypothetical protein